MKLVSPYKNIKEYTRISIEPFNMNSDIKNYMKKKLKEKVEKKCNRNGYIEEVYKIVEYSDGFMPVENLNGNAIYNITYNCKICVPVENTMIIGLVKVINQELIIATNGPIIIFLPKEYIDINIWEINDGYININNKKKLISGDYIKVQIYKKKINLNDENINTIGILKDFANDEEVEKYYGSIDKKQLEQSDSNSNFI